MRPYLVLALLCVAAPTARAAPPADVADLFPAETLAYAELHNPAELGPQLAALLKGTPLEDGIALVEGKKKAAKVPQDLGGLRDLGELSLLASPEVLAEFRRLGGVAVGVVGFNDRGDPEVVLAVLTGDSAVAALAARAFLTTSTKLRKVTVVSKVPLFQYRPPGVEFDQNGAPKLATDKPPTEGAHEPTFAFTPGLFAVGTSAAALAPVIKRFLGEEKDALRGTDGFKAAAAEYRKPGLFVYANPADLFAKVDAAGRARGTPFDSELLAGLKLTANPKALRSVAGCARFRDGGVAVTVGATFDPAQKSPLWDFFAGPPAKVDALYHARKPAPFAATVNLPEKDRAAALLGFLDALAKSTGDLGRLPGDVIKDLQQKQAVPDPAALLARVRAVTVVVPAGPELPKDAKPLPLFVLHLDDAAAAGAWEEFLPKLVGEIAGDDPPRPSSETVGGVKVLSLTAAGLPWKSPLHYARRGAVLVLGQDRKLVAAAVAADAGTSVAGGDKPLEVPAGEVVLLGALRFGALVTALDSPAAAPERKNDPPRRGRFRPDSGPPEEFLKELEKARGAFLAAVGELPPAVVSVRRSGAELRFEVFQPKVQNGGLTPVITAGVNWFDKLMSLGNDGEFSGGRGYFGRE
jgi:hypothetical protein